MLRYSGSFKPNDDMIAAIEYCERCLKFCEDIFIELNNQEGVAILITDRQLQEQIKQTKSSEEIEEIARNNSL